MHYKEVGVVGFYRRSYITLSSADNQNQIEHNQIKQTTRHMLSDEAKRRCVIAERMLGLKQTHQRIRMRI